MEQMVGSGSGENGMCCFLDWSYPILLSLFQFRISKVNSVVIEKLQYPSKNKIENVKKGVPIIGLINVSKTEWAGIELQTHRRKSLDTVKPEHTFEDTLISSIDVFVVRFQPIS